jgi:hypothetical protein
MVERVTGSIHKDSGIKYNQNKCHGMPTGIIMMRGKKNHWMTERIFYLQYKTSA